ncbi:ABC transporter substrate-binding protein [Phytohabitans houttuyneae]|uniref:Sugar ABC transporter substrate-binding protein n=1 Tax=Phytohabitans houttuyneae TaxID=1076126 RepID=A0A6V8K7E0_9ACTN|nr:extracellular solute-binding protein [Phytohabitans houttuyneae]GFJ77657.1 sugar ABC transporter substrate-binding protein [Phytohabitans houttuyneae]
MSVSTRRRYAAVALATVAALATTAACGDDSEGGSSSSAKPDKLVVDTFGEAGYEDLVKQYEQQTGIKVELRKVAQLNEFRPRVVRSLATGKGAADVIMLEEGILNEFKLNPNNWVDLAPLVGDLSKDYLSWKYELGKAPDGRLMGLPTDVGSLGICYRTDLFKAANLPTARDEVSALWPTWEKFIETGQKYKQASGKAFVDSATMAVNGVMFQQKGADLFYDKENNNIADKSPAVKSAWDQAIALADAGITAKITTWSPEWNAGFKQGTFAATACPSWMLGIVETNSGPENSGKWDLAAVPGGAGNWGGSWLGVPTQSKHQAEAAKLAAFLTNTAGQVAAFKKSGPLPTNLKALEDPSFTSFTNKYFSDAPTGKIFGESVKEIVPTHLGPKHQAIKENAMEPALRAYETGQTTKEKAWEQFTKDAATQGAF